MTAQTWLCGEVPYTCDGYDPADWPHGKPPAELWRIRWLLQGVTVAQHTYTPACDGSPPPGPCPAARAMPAAPKEET